MNILKKRILLAEIISILFSPIVVFLLFFITFLFAYVSSSQERITSSLLVVGIGVIPSLVVLYLFKRRGLISDYDIRNRQERYLYLTVVLGLVTLLLFLGYFLHQVILVKFLIFFLIWFTLFWAITFFWKISGHTSSVTLVFLLLVSSVDNLFLPGMLIVAAVAWARVVAKHHSISQALGGILLSVGVYFFARVVNLL